MTRRRTTKNLVWSLNINSATEHARSPTNSSSIPSTTDCSLTNLIGKTFLRLRATPTQHVMPVKGGSPLRGGGAVPFPVGDIKSPTPKRRRHLLSKRKKQTLQQSKLSFFVLLFGFECGMHEPVIWQIGKEPRRS